MNGAVGIETLKLHPLQRRRLEQTIEERRLRDMTDKDSAAVGPRVLLVEDSPTNRRIGVRMFETLGCRVDVAVNGREAVEKLAGAAYDVVFMDCHMPETDGYEATAAVHRATPEGRRVPIIAMTATATEGELKKCLDAGMDDFISKPATLEELEAMLRRWTTTPAKVTNSVAAGAGSAAPTLDSNTFARILALAETAGAEFVAELLETFLTDASAAIADMREAAQEGNGQRLRTAAHTLKGSSAGLGALEIAATCNGLEQLNAERLDPSAAALLDRLHEQFGRLRSALEQHGVAVKM